MTDTKDIKALREACEILNDHGYMPESGEIRSSNLAEAVRMIIKQSVGYADQLEAERQRADKAELELIQPLPIGELIQRLEGQTHEKWFSLSDLKGEQVPVGWIKSSPNEAVSWDSVDPIYLAGSTTPVGWMSDYKPVYERPQKPVVYLNISSVMSRRYVVKQIEAAGGIVKDGE